MPQSVKLGKSFKQKRNAFFYAQISKTQFELQEKYDKALKDYQAKSDAIILKLHKQLDETKETVDKAGIVIDNKNSEIKQLKSRNLFERLIKKYE